MKKIKPILLSKEMEKNIMLLLNLQCNIGVNLLNPYIFSVPTENSMANMRANDALRKHVGMIPELRYPDAIRCTNLRKHIATMSQLLNLQDTEQISWDMISASIGNSTGFLRALCFWRNVGNIVSYGEGRVSKWWFIRWCSSWKIRYSKFFLILKVNLYIHTHAHSYVLPHSCIFTHTHTHSHTHMHMTS